MSAAPAAERRRGDSHDTEKHEASLALIEAVYVCENEGDGFEGQV